MTSSSSSDFVPRIASVRTSLTNPTGWTTKENSRPHNLEDHRISNPDTTFQNPSTFTEEWTKKASVMLLLREQRRLVGFFLRTNLVAE
jgi:hypothetical protein